VSRIATIRLASERACCTLWLEGCPSYAGLYTACIGGFRCEDAPAGRALLERATAQLAWRGFEYAIGPMDGNTWHDHRVVTQSDGSPAFPLEPANPAFYVQAFADFAVIGRYASARTGEARRRDVTSCRRRLEDSGIRIRNFDANRAEQELLAIYRLSLAAFARNFLYTPISEGAFMDRYRPMLCKLDPNLILLAEDDSLQAFLFALPCHRSVIVKTYASLRPGLGACLLEQLHSGPAAGYDSVVHALMHEHNVSRNTSGKYAATFRRYALFGRRL
jgi:hypothetical protein